MVLELELGITGKGKTEDEAMNNAELNAIRLGKTRYNNYGLIFLEQEIYLLDKSQI